MFGDWWDVAQTATLSADPLADADPLIGPVLVARRRRSESLSHRMGADGNVQADAVLRRLAPVCEVCEQWSRSVAVYHLDNCTGWLCVACITSYLDLIPIAGGSSDLDEVNTTSDLGRRRACGDRDRAQDRFGGRRGGDILSLRPSAAIRRLRWRSDRYRRHRGLGGARGAAGVRGDDPCEREACQSGATSRRAHGMIRVGDYIKRRNHKHRHRAAG